MPLNLAPEYKIKATLQDRFDELGLCAHVELNVMTADDGHHYWQYHCELATPRRDYLIMTEYYRTHRTLATLTWKHGLDKFTTPDRRNGSSSSDSTGYISVWKGGLYLSGLWPTILYDLSRGSYVKDYTGPMVFTSKWYFRR